MALSTLKRMFYRGYMGIYIYIYDRQNYGPFSGTLNIRRRTIIGIQKGTITLTTTHNIYIYREVNRV